MTITKFQFGYDFTSGPGGLNSEEAALEKKLDKIKFSSHTQGFQEGHAQALTETEARTFEALEKISLGMQDLLQQSQELTDGLKKEAASLSYAISAKLAPALLATHPTLEIEALIQDCLLSGHIEPKIIVRVGPTLGTEITKNIESIKTQTGFSGQLVLMIDQSLDEQDCRVEWPNGGAARNWKTLIQDISNKIEAYIEGPLPETEFPEDPEEELVEEPILDEDEKTEQPSSENVEVEENKIHDVEDDDKNDKDEVNEDNSENQLDDISKEEIDGEVAESDDLEKGQKVTE